MNLRAIKIKIRKHAYLCTILSAITLICFLAIYGLKAAQYSLNVQLITTTTTTETVLNLNLKLPRAEIEEYDRHKYRTRVIKDKIKRLSATTHHLLTLNKNESKNDLHYNIHTFYYAWYKNIKYDGAWAHWNHKYLPNWNKNDLREYPIGIHNPPDDIGSNFYPALGCYSSNDPQIMHSHMKQLKSAGIGVLVLSWAPPNFDDSPDSILMLLFNIADTYGIKISLHIEPYLNRNPDNFVDYWREFLDKFGSHNALYKIKRGTSGPTLPVVYIYDSYLVDSNAWKSIFSENSPKTIRRTPYDAIFIGLLVEAQHKIHVKRSRFDGFYTYFAANGFSYGSSWKNWNALHKFAKQNNLIFIPSVGPGYVDVRVRPWNGANTKDRAKGRYYETAWRTAKNCGAKFISITSFNEWHEGTQIEAAISAPGYSSYDPEGPYYYINLTRQFSKHMQINR